MKLLALTLLLPLAATAASPPAACTDFYGHVNAEWLARTELPPDRARIGSFDELNLRNQRLLQSALARLVAEPARQDTPGLQRLAAWYAGGMDDALAERAGLAPLAPWLKRIDALREPAQLPAQLPTLMADLTRHGVALVPGVWVSPDPQDVRRHAVQLSQQGLGLPDRDDYTGTDPTSQRLREAYRRYAAALLQRAGAPHDAATIAALMAFEAELAQAMWTRLERRDPQRTTNRLTAAALAVQAPGLDWAAWLAALGLAPDERPLVVASPRLMQAVGRLAAQAPAATWQAYLRVRLLDEMAPWLDAGFRAAHFDWHERTRRGLQQPPPRAEQLIRLIGGPTGWEPLAPALGELFVREAFSPQAQQRANQLVEDVRAAMRTRIGALSWMSAPTKARALAKLEAMTAQIGAPATWPDYSALTLVRDEPAANAMRVAAWGFARQAADLPKPVDRTRWESAAHIVNAFAAGLNRIVFPAGILQPPFFDATADDAANYGGIGMVIGHEIIHHFDDRGRQYDADGNLADWWAPEDAAAYQARAERVVELYGRYEPLPGLRIDGRQMLGENISDLGGLQIAFDAYRLALQRRPGPVIDGRTPEQRFFVANAIIWRNQQRAQALEQQIRTGQHSPGRYRVLGPMSQMPAFAQAFGCRPGDAMVASDPVAVW